MRHGPSAIYSIESLMLSRSLSHYSTSFTSLTDKPHHEAFRIMDAEVVKLLLVGDEKCGKTTFLSYVSV